MEPGKYLMCATDAQLGMTEGGKEQVAVLLEVVEGEFKGDSLTWYGYFTDKTTATTLKSLRALGWEGTDITKLDSVRGEAACTVTEEEYEGKVSLRVRWVGGGGLGLKNVMDDRQKAAFAKRMQGAILAQSKPVNETAKKPKPPAREPGSDDDQADPFE